MKATPLPFPEFVSRVLQLYAPPLRAPKTRWAMAAALSEFGCRTSAATILDLNTVNVAKYLATRAGCNANTTRGRLRNLKTASLIAVAEGWAERTPQWRRLWPRASPSAARRDLDHGQVVTLLAHLERAGDWRGRRLHALAATVAYTGLRLREALYLHRADWDGAAGLLYVVPRRRLKTEASAAPVPVPPELAGVLAAWLPDAGEPWLFPGWARVGPWDGGSPGYRALDRLRQAGEACGVPGVTWHGLRHTLAKLGVGRFGLSVDQVRSLLRHTDPRTTEGYLHRDDAELLRAIGARISFRPPAA